ncbi:noncanonical pyrimidine nucleotidase, YjjG family [Flavobacterium salilacus subsp. salilacus]|uniref:YjjG family noncanonical pyrimidine nucleotidase n=1 Tax=Flavobacterium TaxID=237 RepID=UPI001075056C|nr:MULTISPECIES: YjjG family noncanonical pyrimidine nucleotidase [Flavobacterium]KAF2519842.1 noncanonical pyrimidine nucleotidase, YjjG family [Flavobacterium salilacus subsp. salilacus]MBE1614259.1 noncanonical pyrimidine nucleotidase, YjjG family [Flavobacterium sp. SaA2.13]
MRITDKKTVFFDLDHTLWDFEKNSAFTFETILVKHNIGVEISEFIAQYVPINLKYWKLYRDGKITQQELRYQRFKEAFDILGFVIEDDMINLLSDDYIKYLPTYNYLYEGAVEVLEYLKPKYSLHIITNGFHEVQNGKLKNSNIHHYFETVTNSELAGCKKPNPAIYEYALRAAKAEKHTSIMIGDCIEADVQGALDYGLDAIYFNEFNKQTHTSIKQINHLLDLKNLL